MFHPQPTVPRLVALAAALLAAAAFAGCGGSDEPAASSPATQATQPAAGAAARPVLGNIAVVESAAQDTIDQALSGDRAAMIRSAELLARTAAGPAEAALHTAGVPAADIALFQKRSANVARLARDAPSLDVAIAANAAFAMVPGFLARAQSAVPAGVTQLESFEYDAELRAKTGEVRRFADVVGLMIAGWQQLRPQLIAAGGAAAAAKYQAHLRLMGALAKHGGTADKVSEAGRGLDLVDELAALFG